MGKYGISLQHIASGVLFICFQLSLITDSATSYSIEKEILNAAPKADMFNVFHLMPQGEVMIMKELDLLLTLEEYKYLYSATDDSREKRKAIRDFAKHWKDRTVYFEIDKSIQSDRGIIEEAIKEWQKYTCLRFTEDRNASSRIQFKDGGGCYSMLGMQKEPQPIVLAQGCRTKGIIIHEIGHAIGWIHEHMRPDRDDHIRVNFNAIGPMWEHNFMKYNSRLINTYNIQYDYTSIMHYGTDFLPDSITTLIPAYQSQIGQRTGMSFRDIKLANVMYNCASVPKCPNTKCENDGFVYFQKYKNLDQCKCWCDSGNLTDPLVPCSSLKSDKKKPRGDKGGDTKKTENCMDIRDDCDEIKQKNKNICMNKMELMMVFCARTCNFCGKGKKMCMDYEKSCELVAASGACEDSNIKTLIRELCPASCKQCEPASPCEIQSEMMGLSAEKNVGVELLPVCMLSLIAAAATLVGLVNFL